ncbi:MAG: tetratricopeptide repeat protein [Myxococcales bacterium]|nr:serine/threonine-protein kinase PknG [Polyangiaceae bacterium]MDW8251228.1 tetratricopeptide repeat protein [Myxococcales bacterium]
MMIPCAQPACPGQIEDGYCDTCGLAPLPAPLPPAIPPSPASPVASGPCRVPREPRLRLHAPPQRPTRKPKERLWPPLPPQDPLGMLVASEVPPQRRRCSSCEEPLFRERGNCPRCGHPFSFVPAFRPGEVLSGRYEIKGTLAFGGLGWIYLALDLLLGRWVTLKGLLDLHDPRLLDVAVQEREYLAAVKHPNIVAIHDFLVHERQGFLIMEFVNGSSLMKLRQTLGPLPVGDALGYLHDALLALGYLHDRGLIHCDFKPNNVMIEEDTLKLIDLGAVRRIDDCHGEIYGSRGYMAPEAAEHPSPRSDIFSVGRSLAVLVASFDYLGAFEHHLPPPSACEVFQRHPALYALLRRATAPDPARRFASAEEFREQILGVLALEAPGSLPQPLESRRFLLPSTDSKGSLAEDRSLPELLPEEEDSPGTWRARWELGRTHWQEGRLREALNLFQEVTDELPGELAPLLAQALVHEAARQYGEAAVLYERVLRADLSCAAAAFGASRCRVLLGQRREAILALRAVPVGARHRRQADLQRAALLLQENLPDTDDALEAAGVLGQHGAEEDLTAAVLRADALAAVARRAALGEVRGGKVLGVPFEARALRQAAEAAYRRAAALTGEARLRAHLIDEAVAIRPWSFW